MKFRLSTLLLLIALASVSIGWIVDRTLKQSNEEAIGDRERLYSRIYWAERLGVSYLCYTPSDVRKEMQTQMVDSLILLWKNEDEYRKSYLGDDFFPPEYMARSFLASLECDSIDSFREFALSLYRFKTESEQQAYNEANDINVLHSGPANPPPNEENFPVLHDPKVKNTNHLTRSFTEHLRKTTANDGITNGCTRSPACKRVLKQRLPSGLGDPRRYPA